VGNPPYDEKAKNAMRYRADLVEIADGENMVLPKGMPDNVNLAVWFILLAVAWLEQNGRIALVLPASILQNEKHVPVLSWIRSRFDISVWHTESDVWFSDARVAPIALFMIPRSQKTSAFGKFEFINVAEPISGDIDNVDGLPRPTEQHAVRDLSTTMPDEDAIILGTQAESLNEFEQAQNVVRLGEIAGLSIYRGNKLGHG